MNMSYFKAQSSTLSSGLPDSFWQRNEHHLPHADDVPGGRTVFLSVSLATKDGRTVRPLPGLAH